MKLIGPGKQQIYDLAKAKMGAAVDEWLVTPREEWRHLHDGTPHGLLDSGCPTCMNEVLQAVEAMP